MDGHRAVIGARRDGRGAAYVFDVETGEMLHKLVADDAADDDRFGVAVDIAETTAIVGARWDDDQGNASGSAYLFDVHTGRQLHKLTPHDRFGTAVALSGNRAIVGSPFDDDVIKSSGAAYVFDVATGTELMKLTPDDLEPLDHFGISVNLDGWIAVIGANNADDLGAFAGAAYLFDIRTGRQIDALTATDGMLLDLMGTSVAIDGRYVTVGAPQTGASGGRASGKLYLYDLRIPEPTTLQLILGLLASEVLRRSHRGKTGSRHKQ